MVLYENRVNRHVRAGDHGPFKRKVQIARTAVDAEILTASTPADGYPMFRRLREEAGIEATMTADESRYVTGFSLPVDAGSMLK
jgi:hypothetical protein